MKAASGGLISLLNTSTQFMIADVLTIVPQTGSPIYLTSAPTNITVVSRVDNASHTFLSGGISPAGVETPIFSRGGARSGIGTKVADLSITIATSLLATIAGVSWPQSAVQGFFDGARMWVERVIMPTWGDTSRGTFIVFAGRAGNVQPTRYSVALSILADLNLLQLPMPRNVWQPGCLHNLYDAGCTLLVASFTISAAVSAGSTASAIKTTLTQADGYFDLGAITFTSGGLNGRRFTVKAYLHANGLVTPAVALPSIPAAGNTFTIYPGCDKQQATCTNKFANLTHFRGYPYIPPPEASS